MAALSALQAVIVAVRDAVAEHAAGPDPLGRGGGERLAAVLREVTGDHPVEIEVGDMRWRADGGDVRPRVRIRLRGWLDGDEVEADVTLPWPAPPAVAARRNID